MAWQISMFDSRPQLASLAITVAAAAALFTFAGALIDPAAAADSRYLAFWAAAILVVIAGLAVSPPVELMLGALLAILTVWAIPYGTARAATVGLLLVTLLVVAAMRGFLQCNPRPGWHWALTLALGLQLLWRSDRLVDLSVDTRLFVGLFLLPVAVAGAWMLLRRVCGSRQSLLALGLSALLVPGWSVTMVLSLLALVIALLWHDQRMPRLPLFASAIVILAAALFWLPPLLALLGLLMAAVILPPRWLTAVVAAITIGLIVLVFPGARNWTGVGSLLAIGPLLLPAALLPAQTQRANALQGLMLAVLALRVVPDPAALAGPLALVALSVRPAGIVLQLQLLWTGTLVALTTLLAAYPWLRPHALADALSLFGLEIGWPAAALVVAMLWGGGLLCAALAERLPRLQCSPVLYGYLLLGIAVWNHLPQTAIQPLAGATQILDATNPRIELELPIAAPTHSVIIDSYLDNSATLTAGTPVARLVLTERSGQLQSWMLRAGFDTGEWAARRPEIRALPGFAAPSPWLGWVTPDGSEIAQRYRARWTLPNTVDVIRIRLERSASLPTETSIAVFHVELRP